MARRRLAASLVSAACVALPTPAAAQDEPRCVVLCAPELKIEAEVSLDYLATGLRKAGDIIGDERFLDDANPWSFSVLMIIPLAPLAP
jgi:hypothetical protein